MSARPLVIAAALVVAGGLAAPPALAEGGDVPGVNELVSVRPDGTNVFGDSVGGQSSADGRFVVFSSEADELVEGPLGPSDFEQVYVRDVVEGTTTRVSVTPDGEPGNGDSQYPVISADGRYVAYMSDATDIVDSLGDCGSEALRVDLHTMETIKVSHTRKDRPTGHYCAPTSISGDGSKVLFTTWSRYVVRHDRNKGPDVFLYQVKKDRTMLVSRSMTGQGTSEDSSGGGMISADGRLVAFDSSSTDIAEGASGNWEIVLFDVRQRTNRMLTRGDNSSFVEGISASGSHVVFMSHAEDLLEQPVDGRHAYRVSVASGKIDLVDRASDGTIADRGPYGVSISANGKVVAFGSQATNLVPGLDGNDIQVYVRNLSSGTTSLVSYAHETGEPANDFSSGPYLSADGSAVVYSSIATDLVPEDTDPFRAVIRMELG